MMTTKEQELDAERARHAAAVAEIEAKHGDTPESIAERMVVLDGLGLTLRHYDQSTYGTTCAFRDDAHNSARAVFARQTIAAAIRRYAEQQAKQPAPAPAGELPRAEACGGSSVRFLAGEVFFNSSGSSGFVAADHCERAIAVNLINSALARTRELTWAEATAAQRDRIASNGCLGDLGCKIAAEVPLVPLPTGGAK